MKNTATAGRMDTRSNSVRVNPVSDTEAAMVLLLCVVLDDSGVVEEGEGSGVVDGRGEVSGVTNTKKRCIR